MLIEGKNLIHLHTRQQEPESNILPVSICVWKKMCSFPRVTDLLSKQNFKKLHKNVWVYNPGILERISKNTTGKSPTTNKIKKPSE